MSKEYLFRPYWLNSAGCWEAPHGGEWFDSSKRRGIKTGVKGFENDGVRDGAQILIAILEDQTDDIKNAIEHHYFLVKNGRMKKGTLGQDIYGCPCLNA